MSAPTDKAPAETDDVLLEKFKQLADGFDHMDVITAIATLLSQAIADCSPNVERANFMADRINAAIKADMTKNWHTVMARRQQRKAHV